MTLKEAMKFEIKCCKYLIRRLETLRKDIQKQVDKETEARIKRHMELCQYKTFEEAQEAYGADLISDKEYHQVMDMLEKAEETEEPVKTIRSAAVEELSRYISDLKRDVRDLEWDMLTPEEQERIRKANKVFMEKHRKAGDRT